MLLRAVAEGTDPDRLDTAPRVHRRRVHRARSAGCPPAVRFVSLVPTQLQRILADPEATAALATFDAVLVGGASTPHALLDDARQAGIRSSTTYGMSETCGGCVYDGSPLAGASPCAPTSPAGSPGRPGGGPRIPRTARRSRVRPRPGRHPAVPSPTTSAGWSTAAGGSLGRVDDVLITGGVKIAPAGVEATLATVPGVADVVAHRGARRRVGAGGRRGHRHDRHARPGEAPLGRPGHARSGGGAPGAGAGGRAAVARSRQARSSRRSATWPAGCPPLTRAPLSSMRAAELP